MNTGEVPGYEFEVPRGSRHGYGPRHAAGHEYALRQLRHPPRHAPAPRSAVRDASSGVLAVMRRRNWLLGLAAPIIAAVVVGVAVVVVSGGGSGSGVAPSALAAGFPPARVAGADFTGTGTTRVILDAIGASAGTEVESEAGPKLADGAEIIGVRATKLEAVLPGFDETMAKVQTFGTATGQHLASIGEVIDRGVNGLNSVFLEKDADGQTKIDQLITSLEAIINGPEGQKDQSIRGQLETIVGNLRSSSESIRKLADVQGTEQGSLGEMLHVFEQTAKLLSADAESTQKLIAKMGHTSEAVTQASDQVKSLALVTTEAVQQFHSRPFHYLTTTRSAPVQGNRSPEASPHPKR